MNLEVYDWENYPDYSCVSFMNFETKKVNSFVIDDSRNDRKEIVEFAKGKWLAGYNSKTYDDIILNYIIKNPYANHRDLYKVSQKIIASQKRDNLDFYKEFKEYLHCDLYHGIDLMRLLFSKKLRVSLKELECSLNHDNVQELPFKFNLPLEHQYRKDLVLSYNVNDCRATLKVLEKSIKALKLRRWMKETYGIDAFSMDGVNGGVKILEILYEKEIGNGDFKKEITLREWVHIKDIILPIVKFETKEFQDVLERYQEHTWYSSHYDEELFEDSKLKFEPVINGFGFKFSLGGLHSYTKPGIYESNDEYDILSLDVASYYPSMVLQWEFVPGHLNKKIFLKVYGGVKDERIRAKKSGDDTKNETLKLSINGAFGMFGNRYSWLFDHKVRLQICVNGQLMLAMLIEKLFKAGIELIDANTDGVYLRVHKSKREALNKIVKWWQDLTKMELEETKFEKMWFLTTADYFGTYLKKDKIDTKLKGIFITEVQLGKGMEFPIIPIAVKKHFLEGIDIGDTILKCENILDFCSYKRLKKDVECFHNGEHQQKTNRFYACKNGAYLYKRGTKENGAPGNMEHILKDSPVVLYNKFDDLAMKDRGLNYTFYLAKAREIVNTIDNKQQSLF